MSIHRINNYISSSTNGCFNYVQNKTEPVTKRWFCVSVQTILEVYNS